LKTNVSDPYADVDQSREEYGVELVSWAELKRRFTGYRQSVEIKLLALMERMENV